MFTLIALITTIIGLILMLSGPRKVLTRANRFGGVFLIIAGLCWLMVLVRFGIVAAQWLLANAP